MKTIALIATAGIAASASGQISLERIGAFDFTGQVAGNAYSVAWDGSNIFVGSFGNGSGANIVALDDAFGASTFRTIDSDTSIPANRGFNDLDIQDGVLGATVDLGASLSTTNLRVYDAAAGTLTRNAPMDANAGLGGLDFDPINGGLAYAAFGSGRFRQIDPAAGGATIWTSSGGPINFNGAWGTAWRDMAIDASGNIYAREGDQLVKFGRTGADSIDGGSILNGVASSSAGDNTVGQNVEVSDDFGGVVFWNDRSSGAAGQNFADVLQAVDQDGNALSVDFVNAPSFFTNNGLLDFSYDAASQTLAVSEFSSNRVYIYSVVPAPATGALLGLGGLAAARRRR